MKVHFRGDPNSYSWSNGSHKQKALERWYEEILPNGHAWYGIAFTELGEDYAGPEAAKNTGVSHQDGVKSK